jgi:hypothetical protein
MPREPIDYSRTIIYKIVCKDLSKTDVYVGHTTDFKTRKNLHKSISNNEKDKRYNLKVYQYIRENEGWENFDMIEIEKYIECKDANEARKRERYWYEELNAKLNSICPQRTQKEYNEENKEKKKEKNKEYREQNKEKIKELQKKWEEENKEKIKERKKKYFEENKDKIKEYKKKWREENKEKTI